jgi:hypothetical protein
MSNIQESKSIFKISDLILLHHSEGKNPKITKKIREKIVEIKNEITSVQNIISMVISSDNKQCKSSYEELSKYHNSLQTQLNILCKIDLQRNPTRKRRWSER